jgi:hypothetical protein
MTAAEREMREAFEGLAQMIANVLRDARGPSGQRAQITDTAAIADYLGDARAACPVCPELATLIVAKDCPACMMRDRFRLLGFLPPVVGR